MAETTTPAQTSKKPAMIGSYSMFSVLALIFGFVFWPAALVLGIMALSEIKKNPGLKSKAMAWVGILLEPIIGLGSLLIFIIFFIIAAAAGSNM